MTGLLKIDAKTAKIKFSQEVVKSLGRLEALVHGSAHYSPELLKNLQDWASGRPISGVSMALTEMALITRETMKHVNATGDTRAEETLGELISALMGLGLDPNPVSVLPSPRTRAR